MFNPMNNMIIMSNFLSVTISNTIAWGRHWKYKNKQELSLHDANYKLLVFEFLITFGLGIAFKGFFDPIFFIAL